MPPLHKKNIERINNHFGHEAGSVGGSDHEKTPRPKNRNHDDTPRSFIHNDHTNSAGPILPPESCSWTETTSSEWRMTTFWVVGMMILIGVAIWLFAQSVWAALLSILAIPFVAIVQGSLAILRYRMQFRDCPLPKAPSHGIVKCLSNQQMAEQDIVPSLCADDNNLDTEHNCNSLGCNAEKTVLASNHSTAFSTPLRLLVIGDSLAIGVGQSKNSIPIMPETIAMSLSKAMNGRPVLWTCHGAPGASAGWIVQELERSVDQGGFLQTGLPFGDGSREDGVYNTNDSSDSNESEPGTHLSLENAESFSSLDACSPDEKEKTTASGSNSNQNESVEEMKFWSDRLKLHQIQFDPSTVGPFDIAVVLTGSNDLKSAFFPCLLKGEDAEFWRQAQERGGGYGNELARVLEVLNQRMRKKLQTIQQSVEAATEKLKESVENIRERLGSHDFSPAFRTRQEDETLEQSLEEAREEHCEETTCLLDADSRSEGSTQSFETFHDFNSHFPVVVLPGMPARALPIFQSAPLRWLAVPIVDFMDSHKRKLAREHDGEVMFVEAPSCEAMAAYSIKHGQHHREESDDNVLLNLRGIKKEQARSIESEMDSYFNKQSPSTELSPDQRHQSMFSVDGIHPNDEGYRFWGRFIADAIIKEWKQRQGETEVVDANLV